MARSGDRPGRPSALPGGLQAEERSAGRNRRRLRRLGAGAGSPRHGRQVRAGLDRKASRSAMAEVAIDDRCATVNPFQGVRLRAGDPRVVKPGRETRIWKMREFAAAAGSRNEPMIRMLPDCGMRVGEMLALRRALQDLKIGIFRIKGTAWNGAMIETSREKNHDREGPIPPGTLGLLRAMPARIDVEWLFSTPGTAHTHRPRIDWPSHEELQAALKTTSYRALGRSSACQTTRSATGSGPTSPAASPATDRAGTAASSGATTTGCGTCGTPPSSAPVSAPRRRSSGRVGRRT
jgi:integrase